MRPVFGVEVFLLRLVGDLFDEGVVGVDLHDALFLGDLLSHRAEEVPHLRRYLLALLHEADRRIHEAVGDFDVFHERAERIFKLFHEAALFDLGVFFLLFFPLRQHEVFGGGGDEVVFVEFTRVVYPYLVHGVAEEQHFDAFLFEGLEFRGVFKVFERRTGEVVYFVLARGHVDEVIFERRLVALRDVEEAEFHDILAVAQIGDDALFKDDAEGLPELVVAVGLVLPHLVQGVEDLLYEAVLDLRRLAVLLEHLARDVEREVLGVHDALDEAHVFGDQIFAVVHDEYAADVELYPVFAVLVEEVHRRARGDEEQRAEFARALRLVVDALERVFPVVRDVAVEVVELVVADILLRACPEGLHRVDGLLFFILFLLFLNVGEVDRIGDEVGVFFDDAAQRPLREVILRDVVVVARLLLLFHVEGDGASVARAAAAVNRVGAVAGRFPLPAFAASGLQRLDGDAVGGDKAGVEANAKLPYEVAVRAVFGLLHRADEFAGAAARDCAEV